MQHRPSTIRGYTLLETLVAILILSLSIVVPMTIASRTLVSSTIAREQIVAIYLAQEGIEAIRNLRDKNSLSGDSWLQDIPIDTDFTIDATVISNPTISTCSGACAPIKYDSSTHLYNYSTGADTNFVRVARVSYVPGPGASSEVSIAVTVSWNVGPFARSFTARENLFDWE